MAPSEANSALIDITKRLLYFFDYISMLHEKMFVRNEENSKCLSH